MIMDGIQHKESLDIWLIHNDSENDHNYVTQWTKIKHIYIKNKTGILYYIHVEFDKMKP